MAERELTRRQLMAPDVYPPAPGEGQRSGLRHALALAAILAAPFWIWALAPLF